MLRVGLAFVVAVLSSTAAYSADMAAPDCTTLKAWTDGVILPDPKDPNSPRTALENESVQALFSDGKTAGLFEKPYSQWSDQDKKTVAEQLNYCILALQRDDTPAANRIAYALGAHQQQFHAKLQREAASAWKVEVNVKKPECRRLLGWFAEGGDVPDGTSSVLAAERMFEDPRIVPLFGLGVDRWNAYDLAKAHMDVNKCRVEAFPRDSGKRMDRQMLYGYQLADSYLKGALSRHKDVRMINSRVRDQLNKMD